MTTICSNVLGVEFCLPCIEFSFDLAVLFWCMLTIEIKSTYVMDAYDCNIC